MPPTYLDITEFEQFKKDVERDDYHQIPQERSESTLVPIRLLNDSLPSSLLLLSDERPSEEGHRIEDSHQRPRLTELGVRIVKPSRSSERMEPVQESQKMILTEMPQPDTFRVIDHPSGVSDAAPPPPPHRPRVPHSAKMAWEPILPTEQPKVVQSSVTGKKCIFWCLN